MSWYSKVFWSEGLFLRPHHLQQNDRYVERLIENRVRQITPYPWGFSVLEIDQDLAQQSKFSLRRARPKRASSRRVPATMTSCSMACRGAFFSSWMSLGSPRNRAKRPGPAGQSTPAR